VPELAPVLQRMLALWNGEDVDARSVYAYGCIENGGGEVFDPEAIPPLVDALRSAAPDLRFELLDWFVGGSRYVLRLRAAGTHRGPLATPIGVAEATGQAFAMHGIEVFEVHDDLITAVWIGWNYGELYAALGARF
jgi:SnoaL-like polyketide cyclase